MIRRKNAGTCGRSRVNRIAYRGLALPIYQACAPDAAFLGAGASRHLDEMGTTASPWRYDGTRPEFGLEATEHDCATPAFLPPPRIGAQISPGKRDDLGPQIMVYSSRFGFVMGGS